MLHTACKINTYNNSYHFIGGTTNFTGGSETAAEKDTDDSKKILHDKGPYARSKLKNRNVDDVERGLMTDSGEDEESGLSTKRAGNSRAAYRPFLFACCR